MTNRFSFHRARRMRSAANALLMLFISAAFAVLNAGLARADVLNYTVNLGTVGLQNQAGSNFALAFTLTTANGQNSDNPATLSNFDFNDQSFSGGFSGSPTLRNGATSPSSGTFNLTQTAFRNSATQGFTPGDLLSFTLQVQTTNTLGASGGNPDQFSFVLLNNGAAVPTFDAMNNRAPGDALFSLTFDSLSNPTITTYASPSFGGLQVEVTPVPEPTSLVLLLAGLPLIAAHRRRRVLRAVQF